MTTKVIVEAHCDDETEVVVSCVSKDAGSQEILQNGEKTDFVVYDDIVATVKERKKEIK